MFDTDRTLIRLVSRYRPWIDRRVPSDMPSCDGRLADHGGSPNLLERHVMGSHFCNVCADGFVRYSLFGFLAVHYSQIGDTLELVGYSDSHHWRAWTWTRAISSVAERAGAWFPTDRRFGGVRGLLGYCERVYGSNLRREDGRQLRLREFYHLCVDFSGHGGGYNVHA